MAKKQCRMCGDVVNCVRVHYLDPHGTLRTVQVIMCPRDDRRAEPTDHAGWWARMKRIIG